MAKNKRPSMVDESRNEEKACFPYRYETLPFLQRGEGTPELAIFHASVSEVLEWATVDELGPKSKGPQRERREARVAAIARFLGASSKNAIPTAVIIAFEPGTTSVETDGSDGKNRLVIPGPGKPGSVVDGQHRLYGMYQFDPDLQIVVVALLNADKVERAFHFLVINNKASRVPPTHTKALLAKMSGTNLADRLLGARLAFDSAGIKDVDLINTDSEGPFYLAVDWPTTPRDQRRVPATAIESSLQYILGLGVPEYEDRDIRRSVFLAIWKTIKSEWPKEWENRQSHLLSKVGIMCLTRLIIDFIVSWSDSEDLEIEVTNLEDIEEQTRKITRNMNPKFWVTPWAEKAQGGFDTTQGRERVLGALKQLFRNGKKDVDWYIDIDILDQTAAAE